jgi:hypothetical protein
MKHIFHYFNFTKQKHYVYIGKCFDYSQESTSWMCDQDLPKEDVVYSPSLDIVEKTFSFDTETEAVEKISTEYGKQSKEIRSLLERALDNTRYAHNDGVANVSLITDIENFLKQQ